MWGRLRTDGDRAVLSLTSTADEATSVTVGALRGDAVDALTGERFTLTHESSVVDVPARGSRLLIVDGAHGDA